MSFCCYLNISSCCQFPIEIDPANSILILIFIFVLDILKKQNDSTETAVIRGNTIYKKQVQYLTQPPCRNIGA